MNGRPPRVAVPFIRYTAEGVVRLVLEGSNGTAFSLIQLQQAAINERDHWRVLIKRE
jgi:hypothetical protein